MKMKIAPKFLATIVSATALAAAYGDAVFDTTSGDWMEPANWSTGALPTSADIAKIGKNDGNDYFATLKNPAVPQVVKALYVGADNRDSPSTLVMDNAEIVAAGAGSYVGYQGTSILAANDSTLDFGSQDLMLSRPNRGRCFLALTNSTLSCRKFYSNNGGMSSVLANHSTLSSTMLQFGQQTAGTNGLVHLDNGSTWTVAGNVNSVKGDDRLVLSGGSLLDVLGSFQFLTPNCHAVVTDPGSALYITNGTLQTAFSSSLTITNGAEAHIKSILLNDNAASGAEVVTVTGAGSLLNATASFKVGNRGTNALLRIVDGGTVFMPGLATFYLGGQSADVSNSFVLVSGPGSTLSVPYLYAGHNNTSPTNTLLATDGALVDVRNRLNSYKDNAFRFEDGAALQFNSANPNFYFPVPELCVFDGSSLSFTGIADANVHCSTAAQNNLRNGFRSTYAGDVGFRLAGATNLNSSSQGYTFAADASNPAHFTRLEFIGGTVTNLYRGRDGDAVVIGTADAPESGALVARDSASIIALPFEAHGPLSLRNAMIAFTQGASFSGSIAVDLADLPELAEGEALLDVVGDLDFNSKFVFSGIPAEDGDITLVAYTGDYDGILPTATGMPDGRSLRLRPGSKRIVLADATPITVLIVK
ncbi:MAG: hypothetical protein ACOX9C_06655 [Kiritimatiellia bacterium]|jgi:T5SS/PEP-CTERM-associated repeat protein